MKVNFFSSLLFFSITINLSVNAQNKQEDAFFIKSIYNSTLTEAHCYDWLGTLTQEIGARLSGSFQAAAAIEFTKQMLDSIGVDKVWLQECTVPHWERGDKEIVRIINSSQIGTQDLRALALGNSDGTGPDGIVGSVIEVRSLDELADLGDEKVKGKIVFFNRPMDPTQLRTGAAYGGAVDQRGIGPYKAGEKGAIGAIVRSMTTSQDDVPHTGATNFPPGSKRIPAIAISTNDANLLSRLLKNEEVKLFLRNTSKMLPEKKSYNVIGEITGSEFPNEIILVGGHLDSWDVGQGAHDDGAGCVHAMEVLHQFITLGIKPKRTLRCVLYMNEENGSGGSRSYTKYANSSGEFHLAALESDAGGFTPRGFSAEGDPSVFKKYFKKLSDWSTLLEPYGLRFSTGGSGADISSLKSQKGILIGFRPDSQRYFDYHHTHEDTFDKVNKRELEMGAAAITSLIYLIDKYGLE